MERVDAAGEKPKRKKDGGKALLYPRITAIMRKAEQKKGELDGIEKKGKRRGD